MAAGEGGALGKRFAMVCQAESALLASPWPSAWAAAMRVWGGASWSPGLSAFWRLMVRSACVVVVGVVRASSPSSAALSDGASRWMRRKGEGCVARQAAVAVASRQAGPYRRPRAAAVVHGDGSVRVVCSLCGQQSLCGATGEYIPSTPRRTEVGGSSDCGREHRDRATGQRARRG